MFELHKSNNEDTSEKNTTIIIIRENFVNSTNIKTMNTLSCIS